MYNLSENKETTFFISWGFGVQSTALSVMAVNGDIPYKVRAIIGADPGWEHSKTKEVASFYIDYFSSNNLDAYILDTGNIREEELVNFDMPFYYGNGGLLRRQCTANYKIRPIRRKIRELLGLRLDGAGRVRKKTAGLLLGISLDEYWRMKDSTATWVENIFPLIDLKLTREDCIDYLRSKKLPVPGKSSCVGCPYKTSTQWLSLKNNSPAEFEDACTFDDQIRTGPKRMINRGFKESLFIYKKRVPLRFADLEHDQELESKDFCDSGYCFV